MYVALWRVLPGPAWVRVLILIVVLAAVLAACVLWVFPWVQELLPQPDVTVEGQ
jgi:hypothetical protein